MVPFRRGCIPAQVVLLVSTLAGTGLSATPEQVNAAIERGKAFIFSQQRDGLWETHPSVPTKEEVTAGASRATGGQWGGETALSVYALLAAGVSPTDSRLAPALKFLRSADIRGTYALGLRAQIYSFLPSAQDLKLQVQGDVARFTGAMFSKGPAAGLFDYLLDSRRYTRFDHSISQFGVLGMWACERAGAEVPTPFWKSVEDAWIRDQAQDGSWCYGQTPTAEKGPRASMTVAGVATLFITQDYVHADNGIQCTGNVTNEHIDRGLKWIGDNFEHIFTDTGLYAPYYAIYGIERVGVASGRKYLGGVNWYERGADFLVTHQTTRGSWEGNTGTCFALLFLCRGHAPVLFNKLQYNLAGKEGNWNQRPRDVANLVRWISRRTERDLNWQIVSLASPVSELLDAPVLFISGNQPLRFTEQEEAKLREYCEAGGLILANADCGNQAFAESFRKLGERMFHDYQFRVLPDRSPIYTNQQYPRSLWKAPPSVLALSNGVRELMILAPTADAARHWQLEETAKFLPVFQLTDDVVLYAIDKKNLLEKGSTFFVAPDPKAVTNRVIKLARLEFAGNWDPEPGGWRRLKALLHNNSRIDLKVSVARLGDNQLGDGKTGPTVAVLTGTGLLKLSPTARQEIAGFIEGNGTLIIDAARGDPDFSQSVETQLQAMLGTDAGVQLKTALPPSAPVYNLPGGAIKAFAFRSFARESVGRRNTPLLSAVKIGSRTAVYFSRLDLSAGLVGQPTDGITGYDPATATAIMTSLVISGGLGEKASVSPTK